MALKEAIAQEASVIEEFFNRSLDPFCVAGFDGRLQGHNPAWWHAVGRDPGVGVRPTFFDAVHQEDRLRTETEIARLRRTLGSVCFESRLFSPDASARWFEWKATAAPDGSIFFAVGRDVTARRLAEKKLRYRANHDGLTGLPNRRAFLERLQRIVRRAGHRGGTRFALLLLDLDGFKEVNDSLGHIAGDSLLSQVARRLEESIRPGDMAGRLGGDEFVALFEEVASPEVALQAAYRIQKRIGEPFRIAGEDVLMSASIGVVLGENGVESASRLLESADEAMYRVKRSGKRRIALL